MSIQRTTFFIVALLVVSSQFQTLVLQAQENKATELFDGPLFNGKDLSGWVLVNTPPETWSVKDGMLQCTGKPIGEMRTERMFQNFELEVEWRHLVPKGNAGIFIWADDITARGVPFHRGIEVQVLENSYGTSKGHTTHGDIFPIHGATMTPINGRGGSSRAFPTAEHSKPSPEWNHYRIVCQDGAISLAVNGHLVTRGTDCVPRKGYICIESEGGVVHYRNMRLRELPPTAISPEHLAISNRGFRSIYTGLDLSGWKVSEAGQKAWQAKDWVLAFDGAVNGNEAALESSQPFDLAGYIFDFRFSQKSKELQCTLPGRQAPLTIKSEGDPQFASSLEKVGNWNRAEFKKEDNRVVLVLNGKTHPLEFNFQSGKLAFTPSGAVELANIYAR